MIQIAIPVTFVETGQFGSSIVLVRPSAVGWTTSLPTSEKRVTVVNHYLNENKVFSCLRCQIASIDSLSSFKIPDKHGLYYSIMRAEVAVYNDSNPSTSIVDITGNRGY